IWKKKHKKAYYKWRIDETYIKIKGKWSYLYRAIDAEGHTLDIWLRKQRDNHSAYAFIKRLIKQFGKPQKVITDQAPSTKVAMRSEEHTSELQSRFDLVCRLLLEKKKKFNTHSIKNPA